MKRAIQIAWRFTRNAVTGILLMVVLLLWVARSPWVQTMIVPYVEDFLTEQVGAPVEVGSVDLHLPGKAVLRDVRLRDQHKRPMFSVHELRMNLLSLPLMGWLTGAKDSPPIRLNHIEIVQPEARFVRSRRDSTWNHAFLIPKRDSTPSKPSKIKLEFPDVTLRGGVFQFVDSTKSDSLLQIRDRINFFNLDVRAIQAKASYQLLPGMKMEGELREFSAIEDRCKQMVQELSGGYAVELKGSGTKRLRICSDHTRLRTGRTQLFFDGEFADERPDSVKKGFYPVFSANLRPSVFDFSTLNAILPKPLPMADPVAVQGYIHGDHEGIYSDSVDVSLFRNTRLRTTIALEDYMNKDSLHFSFSIGRGQVSFDELQLFLKGVKLPLKGIAQMRGKLSGNLKRITSRNLRISYLQDTDLLVDATLDDYQDQDLLSMLIDFKDSYFSFAEVRKLIPAMELPDWMNRFGRCSINGRFKGGISDFNVAASMGSGFGAVTTDIHLILPPKVKDIAYDGVLNTTNLNLAALGADIPVAIPYLNFAGKIKGVSTTWGKMVADINGTVTESNVGGYHLNKLETNNLRIDHHHITGMLTLTDTEGNAAMTVDIQLPDSGQQFIVNGDVKRLDLAHYGVFPSDSIFLTSIMSMNIAGDSIENYTGKLSLFLINLVRDGTKDTVDLKNVVLNSKLEEGWNRNITLKSSLADMKLRGKFSYRNAQRLVDRLATEIGLYVKNNDSLTADYYLKKVVVPENVVLYDTITTKAELNHLMEFLRFPLYVQPGTVLRTELRHESADEVNLTLVSDSVNFSGVAMKEDSVHLTLLKQATSSDLIGVGIVQIDTVKIGTGLTFCEFVLEPSAVTDELDMFLRARQPKNRNEIVLNTTTNFLKSGEVITVIKHQGSHLGMKEKAWTFAPENRIVRRFGHPPSLHGKFPDSIISRYHFENVTLRNGNQTIKVEGVISKDSTDMLTCSLDDVRIRSLVEIFSADTSVDGRIHDTKMFAWKLMAEQPNVALSGFVDEFKFRELDSIGIQLLAGWPHKKGPDHVGMRALVGHWGQDSLTMSGWYNFRDDEMNFESDSSRLQLGWVEPFVEGMLSNMKGKAYVDHLSIKGSLQKPVFNGRIRYKGAGFKVNFLNTYYNLTDNSLVFDQEKVIVPPILVSDSLGGSAVIQGNVLYTGKLNLRAGEIKNLMIMDTRKVHNEVFYGRMLLDGDSARVTGPISLPLIEAWVNSGDGSWLDIPLSSYTSATRLDFVEFVDGGKVSADMKRKDEPAGFEMALHVNARPNSKVRLIFDEFVGDIIEATGEGNLNLYMDRSGELTMFGTYVVKEGNYHFTMENVLNKKFTVEEGGKIVWTGSPYEADLDLNAVYRVNADVSALVPGGAASNRIPVEIVMHMLGNLNHPEIDLSLGLSKLSEQDVLGLESYFRGITYDQQELNKQVVSLLMFRRFTGSGGAFQGATSSVNVTSSISELVSNQVNYWIAQAFEDPNLGVEVNSNEFQDLELVLRASLFNDRVTIERNGTIIGNTNNNFSLGDISMLVRLLPKTDSSGTMDPMAGQLVWEVFNREDASVLSRNTTAQGTGIFFKRDFDRRRDLFPKKGNMRKEEAPDLQK